MRDWSVHAYLCSCLPMEFPFLLNCKLGVWGVQNGRARVNPDNVFQLSCSLSSHFCFQSLRDNIVHQNKNANGQERRKETFVWKKPWHREFPFFFFFYMALYQTFRLYPCLRQQRWGWVGHHGVQWVFVCIFVGWGKGFQFSCVSIVPVSSVSFCSSHPRLGCACMSENMREARRIFIIQQFFQSR